MELSKISTSNKSLKVFESSRNVETKCDLSNNLKVEYRRYIRNKILFECLHESTQSLELEPELCNKLNSIINGVSLKQCVKIENHNILEMNLNELTYQEGEYLKSVVEKKLLHKQKKLFDDFKKITNKDLNQVCKLFKPTPIFDFSLKENDQTTIIYRKKLMIIQEHIKKNLSQRSKLSNEIVDIRLKKVPSLCVKVNRECKAKIESNYLKTKIAEYKTRLDIFMEVPEAIEAYKELLKDIKKQQEETELNLNSMRENKKKYETVDGKEFNEILKSYLMYKKSIDKFNKMYDLVK